MISIIIPTLEEEKYIAHLLEDIKKQKIKHEIIIVDAGSKDKTVSIAKKTAKVKIIKSKKKNAAYQRNLGVKNSKGKILVFLDADMRIPQNFLSTILKYKGDVLIPLIQIKAPKLKERLFMKILKIMWEIHPKLSGRGGCLIVKRTAFIPFNEKAAVSEDVGFVLRCKNIRKLPIKVWESPRRYRKEGVLHTLFLWGANGMWRVAFNRSYQKKWKPVR